MENDANPLSPESSVSVRIMPRGTQGNGQVAEVDADDEEGIKNRSWVMFLIPVQLEDQGETRVNQVGSLQI